MTAADETQTCRLWIGLHTMAKGLPTRTERVCKPPSFDGVSAVLEA
jgi:hypothetical protein